jgi:hypothetical protein
VPFDPAGTEQLSKRVAVAGNQEMLGFIQPYLMMKNPYKTQDKEDGKDQKIQARMKIDVFEFPLHLF